VTAEYLTAEHCVIGSILIDPQPTLPIVQSILTPDDFTADINRSAYKAILAIQSDGVVVDPVTVQNRLCATVGDVRGYLMGCMDVTPTAANVEVYVRQVKTASMLRAIREAAAGIQEQTVGAEDYHQVLGDALDTFAKLNESGTGNAMVGNDEALEDFLDYRNKFDENPEAMFVKTGFENLDDLLGAGLVNSGMYIIAARPGVGKTTLALNIADNIASRNFPVLFISLEMSTKQITAKRIARQAGLHYKVLLMRMMGEGEYDKMAAAVSELQKRPLTINRRPGATVQQIESMARQVKGVRCIIVDYLGLVRPGRKGKSRYEEITDISAQLKGMAIRLGIPVLCLAQLNRETERERGKRPQVYHLRDSGAIEQDADGIMLLHRERDDPESNAWDGGECECILAKNRHGETGITRFSFFGAQSKLVPVQEPKEWWK
jgi:replicative DNA helicase